MKYQTLTIVILVSILTISCNTSGNNGNQSEVIEIELIDGQKWKVNAEMTPYILEGQKLLNDKKNTDYKALAKALKGKNKDLIKSCTMNGRSHDELHKWLHPHMQLVNALSKAEGQQEADEVIVNLKKSYEIYNQYFQ